MVNRLLLSISIDIRILLEIYSLSISNWSDFCNSVAEYCLIELDACVCVCIRVFCFTSCPAISRSIPFGLLLVRLAFILNWFIQIDVYAVAQRNSKITQCCGTLPTKIKYFLLLYDILSISVFTTLSGRSKCA